MRRLKLIFARLSKRYNQTYMANQLKKSLRHYQNIESGKIKYISDKDKKMISNILEIETNEIDEIEGNATMKFDAIDKSIGINFNDEKLIEKLLTEKDKMIETLKIELAHKNSLIEKLINEKI